MGSECARDEVQNEEVVQVSSELSSLALVSFLDPIIMLTITTTCKKGGSAS